MQGGAASLFSCKQLSNPKHSLPYDHVFMSAHMLLDWLKTVLALLFSMFLLGFESMDGIRMRPLNVPKPAKDEPPTAFEPPEEQPY